MGTIGIISAGQGHGSPQRETFGRRFQRVSLGVVARIEFLLERRRSRFALLEMTDAQLKDIGLSRADAQGEATRPFWD